MQHFSYGQNYSLNSKADLRPKGYLMKERANSFKKACSLVNLVTLIFCMWLAGCATQRDLSARKVSKHFLSRLWHNYKNCNVIFISLDALQAKHVHALGYFRDITPTIDRLMQNSFNFTNAISVSSWTVPASMSWFTGVYPSEHKVLNKFSFYEPPIKKIAKLKELSPHLVTLAEALKENGYATAGFTGDSGVSGIFGFSAGFDVYIDDVKFADMEYSIPKALQWLKWNRDKKFFLFLHGYDAHGQCEPRNGYDYRYVAKGYGYKYKGTKQEQENLREEGLKNGKVQMSPEDVDFWRAIYDEKINRMDERLNAFLKEVENLGLMRNTIFVITADHGTELYEHGRFDHGFSLYDELIHIPLIIKLPDVKGRCIEGQVSSLDIISTILDLLQIKKVESLKRQLRGRSLVAAMRGKRIDTDVYSETDYRRYTYKRAIRTADGWKFIYTLESKTRELYNFADDPQERENLAEREPRLAYELEQRLFSYFKSLGLDMSGPWEVGCYPVYDSQAPDYKR
jgi:arylsulfatase A-like enzyme